MLINILIRNELIDYKWVFSHESYTRGGNETAHSETHMHVHTCTNSCNSKQLACMQPTECLRSAPALQTQMSKPMQKGQQCCTVGLPSAHCFTPLYWKKATLQVTLIIRRVAARPVTVQASNTEAVWMITINSETFSAQYTHLFSMHLLGDGYTTFTCRLQRGSCKVFVWRRSVSNANLHKHQALHEDGR